MVASSSAPAGSAATAALPAPLNSLCGMPEAAVLTSQDKNLIFEDSAVTGSVQEESD